jgi:hypothetical protein
MEIIKIFLVEKWANFTHTYYITANGLRAGLPDFSWYDIPIRENISNDPQKYQMPILYTTNCRLI